MTLTTKRQRLYGGITRKQNIYSNLANDGSILITREYAPGQVEYGFHRDASGRSSGISMGKCEIAGKRVTVAEYHAHYLAQYNATLEEFSEIETFKRKLEHQRAIKSVSRTGDNLNYER